MRDGPWNGRRVLVTGAAGFIGSHLAEELVRRGADVRAFVRYTSAGRWGWLDDSELASEMEVIAGDIRDPETLVPAMDGVDTVFHLAALIAIPYSYVTPLAYVRTNVEGTTNVLEAARTAGAGRVIHTSTSEVYGTARTVPISEAHPLQGQSPYSASKIGADKIAESFHAAFELPVTVLRPFNTFGPRQSARAVIPTIITQALVGETVRLGAVTPTRDLTFVQDTADGFIAAAGVPGRGRPDDQSRRGTGDLRRGPRHPHPGADGPRGRRRARPAAGPPRRRRRSSACCRTTRSPGSCSAGSRGTRSTRGSRPRSSGCRAASRMRRMADDIARRRELTLRYRDLLRGVDGVVIPYEDAAVAHSSRYVMPIVLEDPERQSPIRTAMRERHGIQTSLLYPAVHEFTAYRDAGQSLPQAERIARSQVTLPLYGFMTHEQQDRVVAALREAL